MISFLVYIIKLLLGLFITTMLVTDINSKNTKDSENLKFMIFCSFFTLTLSSVCSIIELNQNSFYYGSTIIVIFIIINSLSQDFSVDEKLKVYLICICSFLFGIGGFVLTMMGFAASFMSYIILYNSADFHKFFFSEDYRENKKDLDLEEGKKIK
tara:strand:+ start:4088 stop:4552 length:465 start_codon:yes stop_codon:yes gene_type:complete